MEGKDSPWTLESLTIISRMRSLNTLTTTSTGIWPKNAGVMRQECEQTWTRVRVKYYNY